MPSRELWRTSVLFGNYAANPSYKYIYEFGTSCHRYGFTSEPLSSITKDVLVASIIISSCDIKNLTRNDIDFIIQVVYNSVTPDEMREIHPA